MRLTRTLQKLYIILLSLIILYCFGYLCFGASAIITDKAVTEYWGDNNERYSNELYKERLNTFIYALPTFILLGLTLYSIRKKNESLFYWTFLVGLTLLQIIPTIGLLKMTNNDPSFFKPILTFILILFLIGQITAIFKLYKLRDINFINKDGGH